GPGDSGAWRAPDCACASPRPPRPPVGHFGVARAQQLQRACGPRHTWRPAGRRLLPHRRRAGGRRARRLPLRRRPRRDPALTLRRTRSGAGESWCEDVPEPAVLDRTERPIQGATGKVAGLTLLLYSWLTSPKHATRKVG